MGSLVLVENVSLDGVMQAPGRSDEDTRGGFDRGGWAFEWLAQDPEAMEASMAGEAPAAMLFGRRTYLDLVGHWLAPATGPNPFADLLRATPKHVVSSTLTGPLPHPASSLVAAATPTDLAAAVRALVDEVDGEVVVLGSGQLARFLLGAGLVDQLVLTVIPTVLGSGATLWGGTPVELEPLSTYASPRGAVVGTYRVVR